MLYRNEYYSKLNSCSFLITLIFSIYIIIIAEITTQLLEQMKINKFTIIWLNKLICKSLLKTVINDILLYIVLSV